MSQVALRLSKWVLAVSSSRTANRPRLRAYWRPRKLHSALRYHLSHEGFANPPVPLERLAYGAEWLEALDQHPLEVQHLVVHDRHTVGVNAHDAAFIGRHPDALTAFASMVAVTPAQFEGAYPHAGHGGCHPDDLVPIFRFRLGFGPSFLCEGRWFLTFALNEASQEAKSD